MEIEVINSIRESVVKGNLWLKNWKKDEVKHRTGLESICEIVDKYQREYAYWNTRIRL